MSRVVYILIDYGTDKKIMAEKTIKSLTIPW